MMSRKLVQSYRFSLMRMYSSPAEKDVASVPTTSRFQIKPMTGHDHPMEKLSLTRGLASNKFEKTAFQDFFIYPEYSDTDDVQNIEGFIELMRGSLNTTVEKHSLEKAGGLTDEVKNVLTSNGIPSIFVPSEFGGVGLINKDLMRVYEEFLKELSLDWNIHSSCSTVHSACQLLILFGSEAQKQKYLPLMASGKCRPAIAHVQDIKSDTTEFTAEVTSGGSQSLLTVSGMRVTGVSNPNILFVFAMEKNSMNKQGQYSCYIVDYNELNEGDKWNIQREDTLGLNALTVGMLDVVSVVNEDNILGAPGQGIDELLCMGRLPLAAGTVGYCKRLLDELAMLCNRTTTSSTNNMKSSQSGVQRSATRLALRLYALESCVYYLSGMLDEGLPLVADLENALIHRLTRDVLQCAVSTTLELAGLRGADKGSSFERDVRDVSTLLAMNGEGNAVEAIAIATLSSWASTSHKRISSTLRRLLGNSRTDDELKNPKLTHFIAEHAHPSLQIACQELEFSMSRLSNVISKMLIQQGKNVEQDYGSLENLVTVLQNQMVMVAVISRASRSYAIGLRNADIELAWATTICTRSSRMNWFELEAMKDYFGLLRFNPSLLNVGNAIFDLGGYKIESPIQRNW